MKSQVIIVDAQDNIIGYQDKEIAHKKGLLHRAVSVFIFNSKGEWLLQRKAYGKYHSQGLWSNACCTHPIPGESNYSAAKRRVKEELGMDMEIYQQFRIIYDFSIDNGMREHELNTIFIATCDSVPEINKKEIDEYKYLTINQIELELSAQPDSYTCWFKKIFRKVNCNL